MFNTGSNLLTKSGLTVEQIDSFLNGHGKLQGLGQAFIDVENRDGVNAYWGMAQAIEETGWGTSAIAENKNNLFGITAYDSNPYGDASVYNSPADCVEYWGDFIKNDYLTAGGPYFVSPTPAGVARHWATDPNYANQVVALMNQIAGSIEGAPAPAPTPAPVASGNTYIVQQSDAAQGMSGIAARNNLTLSQLESANPQAGHPAGNFSDIWAGDALNIPGNAAPVAPPAPAPEEVYLIVPPAPAGDLSNLAASHGTTVADIVSWNKAKYPSISANYVQAGWYLRVK